MAGPKFYESRGMKRSSLLWVLLIAGLPLLAYAGRKIPTGKSQYGAGADTGTTCTCGSSGTWEGC